MLASKLLFGVPFAIVISTASLPGIFAIGPIIETTFFPVVRDVQIEGETSTERGTSFYVSFVKDRKCEFVGVNWYLGSRRVGVQFAPGAEFYPRSRPVGDQYAGPWLVEGVLSLEGTEAEVIHRCHPLWSTTSPFYRGDM